MNLKVNSSGVLWNKHFKEYGLRKPLQDGLEVAYYITVIVTLMLFQCQFINVETDTKNKKNVVE